MKHRSVPLATTVIGIEISLREDGFSLVELIVAAVVGILMISGASTVILKSEHLLSDEVHHLTLEQTGRRITERISEELRSADPTTVLPLTMADSDYILYHKVTGYTGGAKQLGPQITLAFDLAPGESANGKDDNNDGRIDEGFLTYTENGQSTIRLAGNVLGLRFNPSAGGISFATDVGLIPRAGLPPQKTFTQLVTFRN